MPLGLRQPYSGVVAPPEPELVPGAVLPPEAEVPSEPVPPPLESPDPSEFNKGLREGVAASKRNYGESLRSAGQEAGLPVLQSAGEGLVLEGELEAQDTAQRPPRAPSLDDVTDMGSLVDWAAFNLGRIAPSVAESAVGGLAGAALGGPAGAIAGLTAASFVPQYGDLLAEIRERGGGEQPGQAALTATGQAALDVLPQTRLLRALRTPAPSRIGRELLTQTASEAGTEAAQEALSLEAVGRLTPYQPFAEENVQESLRRLRESAAVGALGGAVAGGAAEVAALPARLRDRANVRAQLDEYRARLDAFRGRLRESRVPLSDEEPEVFGDFESQDIEEFLESRPRGEEVSLPIVRQELGLVDLKGAFGFTDNQVLSPEGRRRAGLKALDPERDHFANEIQRLNRAYWQRNPQERGLEQLRVEEEARENFVTRNRWLTALDSVLTRITNLPDDTVGFDPAGTVAALDRELPQNLVDQILPEWGTTGLIDRQDLTNRLLELRQQIAESSPQPTRTQQPYQRVNLAQKVLEQARLDYPDDVNLQHRELELAMDRIINERLGASELEELASLDETPETEERVKELRRSVRRKKPRQLLQLLETSETPYEFLSNFESIQGPPASTFEGEPVLEINKKLTDQAQRRLDLPPSKFFWPPPEEQGASLRRVDIAQAIKQVRDQYYVPYSNPDGTPRPYFERLADEFTTALSLLEQQGLYEIPRGTTPEVVQGLLADMGSDIVLDPWGGRRTTLEDLVASRRGLFSRGRVTGAPFSLGEEQEERFSIDEPGPQPVPYSRETPPDPVFGGAGEPASQVMRNEALAAPQPSPEVGRELQRRIRAAGDNLDALLVLIEEFVSPTLARAIPQQDQRTQAEILTRLEETAVRNRERARTHTEEDTRTTIPYVQEPSAETLARDTEQMRQDMRTAADNAEQRMHELAELYESQARVDPQDFVSYARRLLEDEVDRLFQPRPRGEAREIRSRTLAEQQELERRETQQRIAEMREQPRKKAKKGKKKKRAKESRAFGPGVMSQEQLNGLSNTENRAQVARWWKTLKLPGEVPKLLDPVELESKLKGTEYAGLLNDVRKGITHGFILEDNSIFVHPGLEPSLYNDILAHELGHAVFRSHLGNADERSARRIMEDYERWRKKFSKSKTSLESLLKSKKSYKAALLSLGNMMGDTPLTELSGADTSYFLDFEEWFADNTARWLTRSADSKAQPRGIVEKLFGAIADAVRGLYRLINPSYQSVDQYLTRLTGGPAKQQVASPPIELPENIRAAVLRQSREISEAESPEEEVITAWIDQNRGLSKQAFLSFVGDVWPRLSRDVKRVLGRVALSPGIQNQLRRSLNDDPATVEAIRSPRRAAALAYQLWKAGQLRVTGLQGGIFEQIRGVWRGIMKTIGDDAQAERIFENIRQANEVVVQGDHRFDVQRAGRTPPEALTRIYERFRKYGRALFVPLDSRLRATENPAIIEFANLWHTEAGGVTTEPNYWTARNRHIGRFMNIAKTAFAGLDEEQSLELMDALYESRSMRSLSADMQHRVNLIRTLMRRMLEYQREAGVSINDLGPKYFPWVMDLEYLEGNQEEFYAVVGQEKYREDRVDLAKAINERVYRNLNINQLLLLVSASPRDIVIDPKDKNPENLYEQLARAAELPPEFKGVGFVSEKTLAEHIYNGLLGSNGYADTLYTMEDQVPINRFINTRLLKFVKPSEMRHFLSDDGDITIETYIRQAVKHAEYSRRLGESNEKLEAMIGQAESFGATPEETDLMRKAVYANMGTYGQDTALWLHNHLGWALPRPFSPIEDKLNHTMGAMLVFQNLKYLGLATITSLVDWIGVTVRGSSLGLGLQSLKSGIREIVRREPGELTHLAEMLGLVERSILNEAVTWNYEGQYMQGMPKRVNDAFFRIIGLEQWTKITRLGALAAAQSFIKRHVERPNRHSERFLTELGIKKEDVVLNPDSTLRLFSFSEAQRASAEEYARDQRVKNALQIFVDESILRPNAAMKTLWGSDPHFMLFQHLKSFMYTFHDRILKRVWHELNHENYVSLLYLGAFIPGMIIADELRELVQHGPEGNPRNQDESLGDALYSGAERGGLFSYGGTLASDVLQEREFGEWGVGGLFSSLDSTLDDLDNVMRLEGDALLRQVPGNTIYYNWFR